MCSIAYLGLKHYGNLLELPYGSKGFKVQVSTTKCMVKTHGMVNEILFWIVIMKPLLSCWIVNKVVWTSIEMKNSQS
jgi:hypothetical protein